MGSFSKNGNNNSQQGTAATPTGPTGAGTNTPTPLGLAGPTTTAKMTPYLQKNPVSTALPGSKYVPGVSDAGPKLPGMAAGFDSHGMPIPPPPPPVVQQPRNSLAALLMGSGTNGVGTQYGPNAELSRLDRLNAMMGSRGSRGGGASQGDRGGYSTSGRDGTGSSSSARGGGFKGF